ncbi:TPA: fimbrial protein [Salmonella enterica]
MKKTLIALTVAASAAVSGSAMAAWSTGGDFSGDINIGGNITTETPAWLWNIGADRGNAVDLKLADAVVSGANNVWSGIGAESFPILMGKTKAIYSGVSTGMAPVITYSGEGFAMRHIADSAPEITLAAVAKDDATNTGQFKFKMDLLGLSNVQWIGDGVTTFDKNVYQVIGDSSKTYGNGWPQNKTYINSMTTEQVRDKIAAILGSDMITIPADAVTAGYTGPNAFNRADAGSLQGAYASAYVANSGELTFPKDKTPKSWVSNLKVTVSYN